MEESLPELGYHGPAQWKARREAWIRLAEDHLYGHSPQDDAVGGEVLSKETLWEGRGRRETVAVCYGPGLRWRFLATLLLPSGQGPFPVITWNQFTPDDPCPLAKEAVVERGYCIAAFDRTQLTQDEEPGRTDAHQAYPAFDWAGIRIWAWGHQKLADYLLTRQDIDPTRLACTGFSRGGKAALAAGIFDSRFKACIPINSGAGGCGCFRQLGDNTGLTQDVTTVESMARVGSVFPHWWASAFSAFWPVSPSVTMGNEKRFPLDSHVLKALIAPRNLLSCEGVDDAWSNPYGTWLTWKAAEPVFTALGGRNAIFYRPGGHEFGEADWRALLDFCDEVFFGASSGRSWRDTPYDR